VTLEAGTEAIPILVRGLERRLDREGPVDGSEHGGYAWAIASLGLLASPEEREAIRILERLLADPSWKRDHEAASIALLRIGGEAVDVALEEVTRPGTASSRLHTIMDCVHSLEDASDLQRSRTILERVAVRREGTPIGVNARLACERLDVALQVARYPESRASRRLLLDVIFRRVRCFAGLMRGQGRNWALDRCVELEATELAGDLRVRLEQVRDLQNGWFAHRLLLALRELGDSLTPEERERIGEKPWTRSYPGDSLCLGPEDALAGCERPVRAPVLSPACRVPGEPANWRWVLPRRKARVLVHPPGE
jgi:hypothetical protein